VLETRGGARSGPDLAKLVEHALRMKALMGFVPRKYDYRLVEALALAGALDPNLSTDQRRAALEKAAGQLQLGDAEAQWGAELGADGTITFLRTWRGVTDAHQIEPGFVGSAEGAQAAQARAGAGRSLRRARAADQGQQCRARAEPEAEPEARTRRPRWRARSCPRARSPARASCSRRSSRRAARASPSPATRASAR
jgi:DNA gyrase subunit B